MTPLRIGTWNLDGRWTDEHARVLDETACDVWLLTEVPVAASLPAYRGHATRSLMSESKHWAAVFSRMPFTPLGDPHPATAAVQLPAARVCASVLPWPLAGVHWPWGPADHRLRVESTLDSLTTHLGDTELIWGGDWNQPLHGNLAGFSRDGQEQLRAAVDALGLQVPTAALLGRGGVQATIDHIAVPESWQVVGAEAVELSPALSDHDLYWVEAEPPG